MKKIGLILLGVITLLGVTGCGDKKESSSSTSESKIDSTFRVQEEEFKCEAAKDYKYYIDNNSFISTDNKIYVKGNFSDGTNCKLINSNAKINKVISSYLADDNKTYYIDKETYTLKEDGPYGISKLFISKDDIIKSYYVPHANTGTIKDQYYYILKTDGKLYKTHINYEYNYKEIYTIIDEQEINLFNGEKIIDVYISEYNSSWVKTDKAYYIYAYVNPDCTKYDDIKCEYTFKKDEEMTKLYDEISYVTECELYAGRCNGFITKDGKSYYRYN